MTPVKIKTRDKKNIIRKAVKETLWHTLRNLAFIQEHNKNATSWVESTNAKKLITDELHLLAQADSDHQQRVGMSVCIYKLDGAYLQTFTCLS